MTALVVVLLVALLLTGWRLLHVEAERRTERRRDSAAPAPASPPEPSWLYLRLLGEAVNAGRGR